jgi:hypothetical protein
VREKLDGYPPRPPCRVEHSAIWCDGNGLVTLPATAETVALYLAGCAGSLAVSTLRRRLAAISQIHQAAGYDNPAGSILVVEPSRGDVNRRESLQGNWRSTALLN